MESNLNTTCPNCTKPIPTIGYFCGACLTQFKCKSCGSFLEKDYIGCVNCGTPKEIKANNYSSSQHNTNTFRLLETAIDRTIEATFSDTVGKDLAGILRDASANKMKGIGQNGTPKKNQIDDEDKIETDELTETVIINNEGQSTIEIPIKEVFQEKPSQELQSAEYPTLIAIAMKNLPKTETEWIVVYAFYASNYGKSLFTREEIINQYVSSNRFDKETTRKNLSVYINRAVNGDYINPLQNGFSILEPGIEKAKEIISRTSSSSPKIFKKKKDGADNTDTVDKSKKSSSRLKSLKRLTNINFEPPGKESLRKFFEKYSPKNDHERNLIFVYYLQTVLETKDISFDHIYSCYDILNLRISENLPQTVRNTASKTGWIQTNNSFLSVTIKGSNQIKAWSKKE